MFHVKPLWHRAAEFAGLELDREQVSAMERFGSWLASEGRVAGGIGPSEAGRIDRRHLADSLLFASQLPADVAEVWDLGSGVGLPGIPLAIALPDTEVVLIDRSGRRVDLARRAIRILDLENCQVTRGDMESMTGRADAVVSRASLPPVRLAGLIPHFLGPGGVAVVAGSWRERPKVDGWETIEIPLYVLDQTVWLLMMRRE